MGKRGSWGTIKRPTQRGEILKRTITALCGSIAVTGSVLALAVSASASSAPSSVVTHVISIRAAHHPGYDRVTFMFTGGLPTIGGSVAGSGSVSYVPRLLADGSGHVIPIKGKAIIHVTFFPMSTWSAPWPPPGITLNLPEIRQIKVAGNYEGYVSYGIGVPAKERVSLHRLTHPDRIYLDIKTP